MAVRILGISAYYHDSAACLVEDGRIVAAAQEERFTRKKHDASFPSRAVAYCLAEAGITASDLTTSDFVVTMTSAQLEALARRFPVGTGKRYLLRAFEYAPDPQGGAPELDDPVAGPVEEYRSAFTVIRNCVDHLILHLKHAP